MATKKYTLTTKNRKDIVYNLKFYFLVPVIIYLGVVLTRLTDGFDTTDFLIDRIIFGSMVSYVVAQLLGVLKKWESSE